MTAKAVAEETSPSQQKERRRYRRTPFGDAVAARVRHLQRWSVEDSNSAMVASAVRALALLRRARGSWPGQQAEIWEDTLGLVPSGSFDPSVDDPSAAELAAHHAMVLFALHRQGRITTAHRDGVGPGRAFATLARQRGGDAGAESEGVRRRFDAMLTAASVEESAGHLRGLVELLRAADIPLDYGQLAEDLADLWSVPYQHQARLRWARQYRGWRPSADAADQTTLTPEPTSEEPA